MSSSPGQADSPDVGAAEDHSAALDVRNVNPAAKGQPEPAGTIASVVGPASGGSSVTGTVVLEVQLADASSPEAKLSANEPRFQVSMPFTEAMKLFGGQSLRLTDDCTGALTATVLLVAEVSLRIQPPGGG